MKSKYSLYHLFLQASSMLVPFSTLSAQSLWTNTTSGTQQWNTAANWSTNPTIPNSIGAVANLSVDLSGSQTVNLASAVTLGSLTYGDTTSAFFAQNITGSTITFNNSGLGATLTMASVSVVNTSITNNFVLNDNLTIVNNGTSSGANNSLGISGAISGTGGIILGAGGGGSIYLSNTANTYSGGFTFNHSSASVAVGINGEAFGTGAITFNAAGTVFTNAPGGANYLLTTSNANVWNSSWTLNGFWNSNGNVTLGSNVTVTRSHHLGLGGNIGQTGGARSLTFAGGNATTTSVLSGINTYTGGTTVSTGSLSFLKTASMPSTGNVSFATGTTLGIGIGNPGGWTSSGTGAGTLAGIFQGTNIGLGAGAATLSYGASVGLNLIVTGNHSYGAIENLGSGASSFISSGLGTLTFTGDNTYTGATTLTGGGHLILDYGSSNTSKFASAQSLTLGGANSSTGALGGGRLTLKGGSFLEIVSATNLNSGHSSIARDAGTAKLRLNGLNRASAGTISFADATIADTDRTNTNGILGGYATIGNDWAVNSTNTADGAITALASYTGALPASVGSSSDNYTLSGSLSLTAATEANTVKITDTGAGESLTLGNNNLTITSTAATTLGGIMYAGGVNGTYTIAGGGTGRIGSSGNNAELIFAVQSGTLTVNAIVGASSNGNSPITKTGEGTLVLGGTNTTSGAIHVNQGVLRLNNAAASGGGSPFGLLNNFVHSGAALELAGGFTFTNDERFYISGTGISDGGALRSVSGANTWRGIIETGQGGARINNNSTGLLTLAEGIITAVGGDVTIGGTGNITMNTPTLSLSRHVISGGGGLIKDGLGTLTLNGPSNYIGATTVNAGTLILTATGSTFASSAVTVSNSGTSLVVNGRVNGTLSANLGTTLSGIGTIHGAATIDGSHTPGASLGIQTFNSGLSYGSTATLNVELVGNTLGLRGTDFDGVNVTGGNLNIHSSATLALNASGINYTNALWDVARDFTIIDLSGGGTSTGSFVLNTTNAGSFAAEGHWLLSTISNDTVLSWVPIPEPSTSALLCTVVVMLLRRRR